MAAVTITSRLVSRNRQSRRVLRMARMAPTGCAGWAVEQERESRTGEDF